MVEVLCASNNNTSTDFLLVLSTNYSMVEVVEMVEILEYSIYGNSFNALYYYHATVVKRDCRINKKTNRFAIT